MKTFDRRSEIIRIVRQRQRTSTNTLSELFGVSEVTIRHDLKILAAEGWLRRVHGGAEYAPGLLPEQPFSERQIVHSDAKESIARAAAAMVHPGDSILLDSSTTAFQLALELKTMAGALRIVTYNLQAAMTLKDTARFEVIILGGAIRGETSSVIGPLAREMLAAMHIDKGFIGASGITSEQGLTDADPREVQMKRAMVNSCRETIVMVDASKFGKQSFLTFASLKDIDHVITEKSIPSDYAEAFAAYPIQVHIANNG